ncbi:MAG: ATP-binding protein [Acidimicrobiia bacterium]
MTDLGSGALDLPPRHRTLRETILWSYELLDPVPQALLRRLGVFAGGFTLEAAEMVGVGQPVEELLEAVTDLLDGSLIRRRVEEGEVRFSLLEPVREFALEMLRVAGEQEQVLRRHAEYFLELAEAAEPHLSQADQVAWIDRLSADHDNLRAALRFSLEPESPDLGLRLAGAVWRFWHASGQLREGRRWLEDLLAVPGASAAAHAKGLAALAGLAYWQADYATAMSCYEEALELYRSLGDSVGEADTLFGMSTTASWMGDLEAGGRLADQARELYEELGAHGEVRNVLMALGFVRWMRGDLGGARPLWEESMRLARELGDDAEAATNGLALASLSYLEGDREGALATAGEGLEELLALKNSSGVVMALDWIAALSAHREPNEAIRLAGAAEMLRARQGGGMRPQAVGLEAARDVGGRAVGEVVAARAWEEGSQLDLEESVRLARSAGGGRPGGHRLRKDAGPTPPLARSLPPRATTGIAFPAGRGRSDAWPRSR